MSVAPPSVVWASGATPRDRPTSLDARRRKDCGRSLRRTDGLRRPPPAEEASPPWSVYGKCVFSDDGSRVSLVGKIRAYDSEGVVWTYRSRTVTPTVTRWARESDYRTSADRDGEEFVFQFRALPKPTENTAFRLTATVSLTRSSDEYWYRERVAFFDSRVGIDDICDQ